MFNAIKTFLQEVMCFISGNTSQTPNTFRNITCYYTKIFTRIAQPKISRKIRKASLGRKNNVLLMRPSPHAISHDDEIFTCELQTSVEYFSYLLRGLLAKRQNQSVHLVYNTKLIKLDEQTFLKQSEMFQCFKGS